MQQWGKRQLLSAKKDIPENKGNVLVRVIVRVIGTSNPDYDYAHAHEHEKSMSISFLHKHREAEFVVFYSHQP